MSGYTRSTPGRFAATVAGICDDRSSHREHEWYEGGLRRQCPGADGSHVTEISGSGYTEADVQLVAGAIETFRTFRASDGHLSGGQRTKEEIARDALAALAAAGRLLPEDTGAEIAFLRTELARYRAAMLAIRDTAPMMDDPEWRRLRERAIAAGYEPSVVTRFQNRPDSLGHTNIVAAYQQGWRDAVWLAEQTRARPAVGPPVPVPEEGEREGGS